MRISDIEIILLSRYYLKVRIFKNTWFARFADKEGIKDDELEEAVNQLEAGQADADLGGGVYKVRPARRRKIGRLPGDCVFQE